MRTQETDSELLFELDPKSVQNIYVGLPGLNFIESLKGHGDGKIKCFYSNPIVMGGKVQCICVPKNLVCSSVQNDAKRKSRDAKRKKKKKEHAQLNVRY